MVFMIIRVTTIFTRRKWSSRGGTRGTILLLMNTIEISMVMESTNTTTMRSIRIRKLKTRMVGAKRENGGPPPGNPKLLRANSEPWCLLNYRLAKCDLTEAGEKLVIK